LALCQVCGKGVGYGHNVSHSKRRTNRRWLPNIQKTKVTVNDQTVRLHVCTRCLRTLQKTA
jgi:large subunit ribosomal protein L28